MPTMQSITIAFFVSLLVFATHLTRDYFAYHKYGRPIIREVSGARAKNWISLSIVSAIYFSRL